VGVFDEHLNRQHRLTYFVRGPEWAFAIPQGDLGALEEVMRRCSTFWNGVGSLLAPVSRDGRTPTWVHGLLRIRPVDACFMHHSLGEAARRSVERRIPGATMLWDGFDEHEVHPLHLAPPGGRDGPKPPLEIPRFAGAGLRRAALAIWGAIQDEDLSHWSARYDITATDGEPAHGALLRGQVKGEGESPLRLCARYMGLVRRDGLAEWPYIWVLPSASFEALVNFWNFRARLLAQTRSEAPVIGLPRESLRHPEQLAALADWLPRVPESHHTPDVGISCLGRLHDEVRAALAAVPLVEETQDPRTFQFGRGVEPNDPATYAFLPPEVGGRFVRGASASALVSFDEGRSSLALPAPPAFPVRTFARTRLVFTNLPLPLPATPSAARGVHVNAEARDGVMLLTNATAEWNFDIRLPTAGQALQDWAADHGFALTRSQDGRDAEALLRRLGTLDALDVLANPKTIALLAALAPRSRVKLARRLVAEAKQAGAQLDEDAVLERLADLGLFLEIEARSAGEIASIMGPGTQKRTVLGLLAPLVQAGFVHRSRGVRCPRCRFRMLLELRQLDETVRCRACGQTFVLPVVDESGEREPEHLYRLDGLMARAMDQDVLPVLLTLRAVRPAPEQPKLFFAWPGVELGQGEAPKVDVDLLVSDGSSVSGYEVKRNAAGLGRAQLRRVMEVLSRAGARLGIAALEGEFDQQLVEQVAQANGRVLTRQDLLG
jgi:hypothetical protein